MPRIVSTFAANPNVGLARTSSAETKGIERRDGLDVFYRIKTLTINDVGRVLTPWFVSHPCRSTRAV